VSVTQNTRDTRNIMDDPYHTGLPQVRENQDRMNSDMRITQVSNRHGGGPSALVLTLARWSGISDLLDGLPRVNVPGFNSHREIKDLRSQSACLQTPVPPTFSPNIFI
jgi:hypothetical protein